MALLKVATKRLPVFVFLAALALWAALPAAAQSTVPDLSQFGYPQVGGSANFTPGQATTVTAGNQMVQIPADFVSFPAKFELLIGDPNFFHPLLAADDQSKDIIAAFAFRVTNMSTGQLVGKFDKPVVWSVTDSSVSSDGEIYNTSPANPPAITDNPTAPTVQGTTLTHSFGGAGVGWLAVVPGVPAGMPKTGAGSLDGVTMSALLAVLLGSLALSSGLFLRRRAHRI
jgi:hypothetical protein